MFLIADINLKDFFYQYYLYPKSLGGTRFDWLFPFEFQRIFWRYKLQYISIAILIYIFIKFTFYKKEYKFLRLYYFLSLILFCLLTIMHQLMTINAIFIYCLIPIFCAFSNIYGLKYLNSKKIISNFLIVLTLCSTVYYFLNYVNNRTFMDLRGIELNNSVTENLFIPNYQILNG